MSEVNNKLTYLGVLTAPTAAGPRAVAIALTGAVELYHLVDGDLDTNVDAVRSWFWEAGINPDDAACAVPSQAMIRDILLPAITGHALVVHHSDLDLSFVDELLTAIAGRGDVAIVSGVELAGPIATMLDHAASRRAFALQARYEAALDAARSSPAVHAINGVLDAHGDLIELSIDGPFMKRRWHIDNADDAFFVLAQVGHLGPLAAFRIEAGPAQAQIKKLANEFDLNEKIAA